MRIVSRNLDSQLVIAGGIMLVDTVGTHVEDTVVEPVIKILKADKSSLET